MLALYRLALHHFGERGPALQSYSNATLYRSAPYQAALGGADLRQLFSSGPAPAQCERILGGPALRIANGNARRIVVGLTRLLHQVNLTASQRAVKSNFHVFVWERL